MLVVINFGDTETQAVLPQPDGFEEFQHAQHLFDLLSERRIPVSGANPLTVQLPAASALLLTLPPN